MIHTAKYFYYYIKINYDILVLLKKIAIINLTYTF